MDSTTMVIMIVGALLLIVAFQTIQLIDINNKMTGSVVATSGSTPPETTQGSQPPTQGLPTQRGGC